MLADYHTHIENGALDAAYAGLYVSRAASLGLLELGLSEHLHNLAEGPGLLKRVPPAGLSMKGWETDAYIHTVRAAGAKAGVEADYIPESENELRSYLVSHDFDYVIGSVHWIGSWTFDWAPSSWDGVDVGNAWRDYFDLAVKAVGSGMFDIFGHPDVIKVFGNKPSASFVAEIDEHYRLLAEAAASTGTCFEVSSAGIRKPCGELYPDIGLLQAAKKAGVDITFASDAHYPEHVGYAFDLLKSYAASAGYTKAAVFTKRRKSLVGF